MTMPGTPPGNGLDPRPPFQPPASLPPLIPTRPASPREQIFREIESERDYQVERWGHEFDDKNTPNDWTSYIARYNANTCGFDLGIPKDSPMTDKQREQYATMTKNRRRDQLVKVAALAIAAIEAQDRVGIVPRHYDTGAGGPEFAGTVYGFGAFLTTHEGVIEVGSTRDAAVMADRAKEYLDQFNLGDVTPNHDVLNRLADEAVRANI